MDEEPLTDLTGQEAPEKEEFHICTELSDFPVSDCPAFLREGVGGVCISGHITIQVLDNKFRIVPNTVFTLLPWQLAFIKEVSEDFRMTFFRISQTMFIDTLSGLWRLRPGFFFYMSRHLVSGSDEGYIRRFLSYCDLNIGTNIRRRIAAGRRSCNFCGSITGFFMRPISTIPWRK